jgi:nitrogen fixation NifU-like protein
MNEFSETKPEVDKDGQPAMDSEKRLTDLYRDTILRHSSDPVAYQLDIDPTHSNEQYNPQCGDRICVHLRVKQSNIEAAAFDGAACAICMASASLLCEAVAGMSADLLRQKKNWFENALKTGQSSDEDESLAALMAVRRFPSRINCALLPWDAAVAALED